MQQFSNAVLTFPCLSLLCLELQCCFSESNTLHISSQIADFFSIVLSQNACYIFADSKKVRRIIFKFNRRHKIQNFIKGTWRNSLNNSGICILRSNHRNHFITILKLSNYVRNTCRRMLQICVHAHNSIPLCMINTGNHRCLMSKITRKIDHLNFGIFLCKTF